MRSLLVPTRCIACRRIAGDVVCPRCRRALWWLADGCPRCALPRPCAPCPPVPWDGASAAVAYDGPAVPLLRMIKERGEVAGLDMLAAALVVALPAEVRADPGVVVAVPPDPRRRRARGVDVSGVLARRVSTRLDAPFRRRALRRRAGPRQAGASRAERLTPGRVSVVVAREVGPRVLLVDDVLTTGATALACANALRTSGVRELHLAVFARTLRSRG